MPAQTEAEIQRKARAFDAQMAASARATGRNSMLKAVEQTQGPAARAQAEARLATRQTTPQADDLAALPKSLAEAKGDGRAYAKADIARQAAAMSDGAAPRSASASASRASMVAELKRQGMEPAR